MANREYMHTPMEKVRVQRVGEAIMPFVRGTTLEAGCGIGEMTVDLEHWSNKLFAIDTDADCVSECDKRLSNTGVQVLLGDIAQTQFPSGVFDTVVMVNILEHVDDLDACMRETKRILRPGGNVVVSVPNAYSLHRRAGVLSGAISNVHDLGPSDLAIGHKRVFDVGVLTMLIAKYFDPRCLNGSYYKPFPNPIMERIQKEDPEAFEALVGLDVRPWDAADIIMVGRRT